MPTNRELLTSLRDGFEHLKPFDKPNELFLSPRTVHRHPNSIFHKLGVSSRTAAARFALEHDLF
jgi:hypothetical protein